MLHNFFFSANLPFCKFHIPVALYKGSLEPVDQKTRPKPRFLSARFFLGKYKYYAVAEGGPCQGAKFECGFKILALG